MWFLLPLALSQPPTLLCHSQDCCNSASTATTNAMAHCHHQCHTLSPPLLLTTTTEQTKLPVCHMIINCDRVWEKGPLGADKKDKKKKKNHNNNNKTKYKNKTTTTTKNRPTTSCMKWSPFPNPVKQ